MNKQLKADLLLIMVTLYWGSSFIITKSELNNISAFNLISLRFIIAFVLSSVIFYKSLIKINLKTIKYGFILGLALFAMFAVMTVGLNYTSASNAGFLSSLAVIVVPILSTLVFKQHLEKRLILSVGMALVGIGLLTLNDNLSFNLGDILCITGALLCAIHIMITEKLTRQVDSVALGIVQFGFVGLFSTITSFIWEKPILPQTTTSWVSVILLAVFCTAIGYMVQTIAQKYTTATHTGLIFGLEPISAAVSAYLFAGEVLSTKGYIGAAVLLSALFIAEINPNIFRSKKLIYNN